VGLGLDVWLTNIKHINEKEVRGTKMSSVSYGEPTSSLSSVPLITSHYIHCYLVVADVFVDINVP
jgi:hypothetical protein